MNGQEIIVILLVVLAVSYLGRHFWRRRQKKAGCASCKLMQAAQRAPETRRQTADQSH